MALEADRLPGEATAELPATVDVVVAGAGNAGMCAAVAAAEAGASVLVLESSPREASGGNSRFALHYAFAYDKDDLTALCPDVRPGLAAGRIRIGRHPQDEIVAAAMSASGGRADAQLMQALADRSLETMRWLQAHGVTWEINYAEAREIEGRFEWENPALVVRPRGGGRAVLDALHRSLDKYAGRAHVTYESTVTDVRTAPTGVIHGIDVRTPRGDHSVETSRVILAAGGFEASSEKRVRHLGRDADLMKVRGTRYNTGECLELALRKGAQPAGQWDDAHVTVVRADAADYEIAAEGFPYAYRYGVLTDARGMRFTDEGADTLHRTYGRLGRKVLQRPGAVAFELFDAKTRELRSKVTSPGPYDEPTARGETVREVAERSELVDPDGLLQTVESFNRSVDDDVPFDPVRLDGRCTRGLAPAKSNWALALSEPPYELFAVAPAITFTYGGLASDAHGRVLSTAGTVLPGLYVAGEMAGTFYGDYPVGLGLTKGSVFGREAGIHAATHK